MTERRILEVMLIATKALEKEKLGLMSFGNYSDPAKTAQASIVSVIAREL